MEVSVNLKQRSNSRGRWSVRLNNELLDLVQEYNFSWNLIAANLGFDPNECKKQYEYLIHPEKYSKVTAPHEKKHNRQKKENEEKHRRRYVRKALHFHTPSTVSKPVFPPEYDTWTENRRSLWNQIPFNANEFYMHYLPPGIEASSGDWSESEHITFMNALENYPPKGKWGLFSLHMLGRTGKECQEYYERIMRDKEHAVELNEEENSHKSDELNEPMEEVRMDEKNSVIEEEEKVEQISVLTPGSPQVVNEIKQDVVVSVDKLETSEENSMSAVDVESNHAMESSIPPAASLVDHPVIMEVTNSHPENWVESEHMQEILIEEKNDAVISISHPIEELSVLSPVDTQQETVKNDLSSSQDTLSIHSNQSLEDVSSLELPLDEIQMSEAKDSPHVSLDEMDVLAQLLSPHEPVNRCVVRNNIVFSESDSPMSSNTPSPKPTVLFADECQPSPLHELEKDIESGKVQSQPIQQMSPMIIESKPDVTASTSAEVDHNLSTGTDIISSQAFNQILPPPSAETIRSSSPKRPVKEDDRLSHPMEEVTSISSPVKEVPSRLLEEIVTPPRPSVKRPIQVENDSERQSPVRFISVALPVPSENLVTPKKKQCVVSTVSPTKAVDIPVVMQPEKVVFKPYDVSMFTPLEGQKVRQPLRVKRLLNDLTNERNRFRTEFRVQIMGLWTTFQLESKQRGTKKVEEVQQQFQDRYKQLRRQLQLEYNSLIASQIYRLKYNGVDVNENDLYNLQFPELSFAVRPF